MFASACKFSQKFTCRVPLNADVALKVHYVNNLYIQEEVWFTGTRRTMLFC